jgi:hypothetical protein
VQQRLGRRDNHRSTQVPLLGWWCHAWGLGPMCCPCLLLILDDTLVPSLVCHCSLCAMPGCGPPPLALGQQPAAAFTLVAACGCHGCCVSPMCHRSWLCTTQRSTHPGSAPHGLSLVECLLWLCVRLCCCKPVQEGAACVELGGLLGVSPGSACAVLPLANERWRC